MPKESDDIDFAQIMCDVAPLKVSARAQLAQKKSQAAAHKPKPIQENLTRYISTEFLLEQGEIASFVRAGQNNNVLRKLRRGFWSVCAKLDLHGCRCDEAQQLLSSFLFQCASKGVCVQIVHGRALGSLQGPKLKRLTRAWLLEQDEVLAFCEAPSAQGGEGAVLVLLKNRIKKE